MPATFDATVLTQKILSCVYRLEERFGVAHVAKVLTGSKAKDVLISNYHKLSTYNIVQGYSTEQLKIMIRELIEQEYLTTTTDKYPVVKLTSKSKPVLQGKEKVFLRIPPTWIELLKQEALKYRGTFQEQSRTLLRGNTNKNSD